MSVIEKKYVVLHFDFRLFFYSTEFDWLFPYIRFSRYAIWMNVTFSDAPENNVNVFFVVVKLTTCVISLHPLVDYQLFWFHPYFVFIIHKLDTYIYTLER